MGQIVTKAFRSEAPDEAENPMINHFISRFIEEGTLSPHTYEFLLELRDASDTAYNGLLESLSNIVDPTRPPKDIVHIKTYHFDMVVSVIRMQRLLPANIEGLIINYLHENPINIGAVIQKLRKNKLPQIAYQSQEQNAAHHSLMHAHEVRVRVMAIITQDLKIYCSDSAYDVFMRNVIGFSIECHDLIQGAVTAAGDTVEKRSADLVLGWLNSEDGLGSLPAEILQVLQYQSYYFIPVATTVAFSVDKPLDLTRLLNVFERYFKEAGLITYHPSNDRYCTITKLIAHIIGCVDTIPSTLLSANVRQSLGTATSSKVSLAMYRRIIPYQGMRSQESGIMHRFISSQLRKYYAKNVSEQYDQQAFLTGLVAKLGMRVELANARELDAKYARLLGAFIRSMQYSYLYSSSQSDFLRLFDREFEEYFIGNAVDALFMQQEKIDAEQAFVNSNYERACITRLYVQEYIAMEVNRAAGSGNQCAFNTTDVTIIEPKAIRADAENIQRLFDFYQPLSIDDKLRLVKELTLNLVLQSGTTYIKQPAEENLLDLQEAIDLPDLSTLDNYAKLALPACDGVFSDLVRRISSDEPWERLETSSNGWRLLSFTKNIGLSRDERPFDRKDVKYSKKNSISYGP